MTVLVTGAGGFVGQNLLEYGGLSDIRCPKRDELNLLDEQQVSNWFELERPKTVIHLAATCGGIGVNKENPGRFIYENLQMGIHVLEACRRTGVQKVVLLGTVCSYPKHAPVPFLESYLWNGYPEETNAPYGIAKKTIMEMAKSYHKQYGLNVTNLIPVNMAGRYDHFDERISHVLPAIVQKFERGGDVVFWGTGNASREFLDAKDCAAAIVRSIAVDTGPEPINLGSGLEIKISELVELVKKLGNYECDYSWDPTKPDGQPRRCVDSRRALDVLGWQAKVSLETTILKTIQWYKENQ